MALNAQTFAAIDQNRRYLDRVTQDQTVQLTRAWVTAWDVLSPELEAALAELAAGAKDGRITRTAAMRSVRLQRLLAQAREILDDLYRQTGEAAVAGVRDAIDIALAGHGAVVTSQLPPLTVGASVGFTRVSPEALTWMVQRATQQIHASTLPLADEVVGQMKRELIRGVSLGTNPRAVASRMMARTESRFNWGLSRALTISRTEMLDANRAATKESERANADILQEWMWSCSFDARTCVSCIAKNGQRFPLDEDGPNDHQNGRCSRVTVTKSWKDLGIDIPEPEHYTPNARAWFDNLDEASQREIMGPGRLAQYQAGKIGWDDMSAKRTTDGWRDSYGVRPLKDTTPKE